jgi:hypothetical protein
MSNTAVTVNDLFEQAIGLEKAMEALYQEFEKMFAPYPEAAHFWHHYADEENGHAAYLERIKAKVDPRRLSQRADGDMLIKAREAMETMSAAKLARINTLEDACNLAIELENSETNTIFEFMIMSFSADELAKSQKFLRTQLSIHIAKLEKEFPNPYRSRAAQKSVPALPKS